MSSAPHDPPPGYVPPTTSQLQLPHTPPPPLPTPGVGYSRSMGISFSPRVIAWLPTLCLTLALIATTFGWVGAYAGGHPVYSQGPWRSMVGSVNRNYQLESLIPGGPGWLDKVKSDWELMVPYLLCLILATVIAWAARGMASLDGTRLPPPLRPLARLWPYRNLVLTALATISLVLIVTHVLNGFGLQRAAKQVVAEQFEQKRKEAGTSRSALDKIVFDEEQEYAKFNLERTVFLYLALGLHVLAVLAIVADAGLERRGNKPPPRIVIQY